MAMDLRLGQFISDRALQPQRPGAAGGECARCVGVGSLEPGREPPGGAGIPQGWQGRVMQPQPGSGERSPPRDAWNSVRPLQAMLVQSAPARNFGTCNKGRAGAVDGRQPFLPVGAPAVNSGVQLGWVHSLCGAAARCWEPSDRGSVAAGCAQRGLFHFGLHVGHGHALPCVNNPAPVESPSCWERSAATAISPGLHTYQLARPFIPIDQGDEESFIERWMGWLGEAAQGQLLYPSQLPELDTQGSWRRGGRLVPSVPQTGGMEQGKKTVISVLREALH